MSETDIKSFLLSEVSGARTVERLDLIGECIKGDKEFGESYCGDEEFMLRLRLAWKEKREELEKNGETAPGSVLD